ncbi:MAG: M24 family metallopeptidase [Chloroflexota bacterium]
MPEEYPCAVPYDPETRKEWLVPRFSLEEYGERLSGARERFAEENLDALLIAGSGSHQANIGYLSNYFPHFGTSFLLVPESGEPTLITNGILHGEPMHSMLWNVIFDDLRPASQSGDSPPGTVVDLTAEVVRERGLDRGRIGVDSLATLSYADGSALMAALPDVEWADGTAVLRHLRSIKSEQEIAYLREACRITLVALETGAAACRPGMTERHVADIIHSTMMDLGSETIGFDTAVSSGPRAGLKHADPTERSLESGDMVFLDAGAVIGGYHADLSRTLAVGAPDSDAQSMLDASVEMFRACLQVIRPGAKVSDIYRAAERTARRAGLIGDYMPNGLGHGVGSELFEHPFLGPADPTVLEPGMVFALEPMLVRYGLGTAVVEETVLVTAEGYELLSGADWSVAD